MEPSKAASIINLGEVLPIDDDSVTRCNFNFLSIGITEPQNKLFRCKETDLCSTVTKQGWSKNQIKQEHLPTQPNSKEPVKNRQPLTHDFGNI